MSTEAQVQPQSILLHAAETVVASIRNKPPRVGWFETLLEYVAKVPFLGALILFFLGRTSSSNEFVAVSQKRLYFHGTYIGASTGFKKALVQGTVAIPLEKISCIEQSDATSSKRSLLPFVGIVMMLWGAYLALPELWELWELWGFLRYAFSGGDGASFMDRMRWFMPPILWGCFFLALGYLLYGGKKRRENRFKLLAFRSPERDIVISSTLYDFDQMDALAKSVTQCMDER
jgi:hypothetical protein